MAGHLTVPGHSVLAPHWAPQIQDPMWSDPTLCGVPRSLVRTGCSHTYSLVSGVAARRRLCSLIGPVHWPWLRPWETRGHCSVSEVVAGLTKSSRAGGSAGAPSQTSRTGAPVGASQLCRHSPVPSEPLLKLPQLGADPVPSRVEPLLVFPWGLLAPPASSLSSPCSGLTAT